MKKILCVAYLLSVTWLAGLLATTSCKTLGPAGDKVITVTKTCAVQAGNDLVGQAILEVESAVAQWNKGAALSALEALAGQYGVSFVSCVVSQIAGESSAALARSDGGDRIMTAKVVNGGAWLLAHPLPQ